MEQITDDLVVKAPANQVWDAIRDADVHADWHPFAVKIVGDHALGATRECNINIGGRSGTTREVCTRFDEAHEIAWAIEDDSAGFSRMVSDWTAGFRLAEVDDATTRVSAWSEFKPRRFFVRFMIPVIRRRFHRTQREILGGLQRHVER